MQTKTPNSIKRSNSSSRAGQKPPTRTEVSAGGVVFQRTTHGPLIAFLLDPYNKWTFAKGHVNRAVGESLPNAARRETEEEMHLTSLTLHERLGTAEIWFHDRYKHKGTLVHKYITYFLMEAPTGSVGYPQLDELIHAVAWVPLSEALDFSSYENLGPVLQKAIRRIEQMTKPSKPAVVAQ